MKKVIIIGATGSLVPEVVAAIKQLEDIELTLFARDKSRLSKNTAEGCAVIEGDAMSYNDLKQALADQHIVYVNLAGNLEAMTQNIVKAMNDAYVKRIIAISSIGIYLTPLKPVLIPYRKLADTIENSDLDYTILRPDWFTNADEVNYMLTQKGKPETGSAISRKSIAAFVALLIANPDLHSKQNLGISKPN